MNKEVQEFIKNNYPDKILIEADINENNGLYKWIIYAEGNYSYKFYSVLESSNYIFSSYEMAVCFGHAVCMYYVKK